MKLDIPHPDEIESVGTQIVIHPWDTWSMDHTLSYIIAPMLVQLKDTKHGAPYVELDDVPASLHPKPDPKGMSEKEGWDTDETHFERWNWVLDEMIWAFTYKRDNFDSLMDPNREEIQKRMSNAFYLFGKYYESLWD